MIAIKLTEAEVNHIATLISDNCREGSYYGRPEQWKERNARIARKLLSAVKAQVKNS